MRLPGLDLPLGTIWCVGRNAIEAVLGDGASRLSVTVARPA